jgi:hypothetical protein
MTDAFGQILSNYQAALHLLEETATEVELQRVAAEVFTTVRDACTRSPGLEQLAAEIVAGPAGADVAAELAAGSHSAGALFARLLDRADVDEGA